VCVSIGTVTTGSEPDLSPGERALLRDPETNDVPFVGELIDLGLREDPPSSPDWRALLLLAAQSRDRRDRTAARMEARLIASAGSDP